MSRLRPPNLSSPGMAHHQQRVANCLGLLPHRCCAASRCSPHAAPPTLNHRALRIRRGPPKPTIWRRPKGRAQHARRQPMCGGEIGREVHPCEQRIRQPLLPPRSSFSMWCATDAPHSASTSGPPLQAPRLRSPWPPLRRLPLRARQPALRAACCHVQQAQGSCCGREAAAVAAVAATGASP